MGLKKDSQLLREQGIKQPPPEASGKTNTFFSHKIDISMVNDNSQLSFNYIWKQFLFSVVQMEVMRR